MSPSAVATPIPAEAHPAKSIKPIKSNGSLDEFESIDLTPVIGTEYPKVQLVDLIKAPNADQLLRDLAIKSKTHPVLSTQVGLGLM
jgi:hypothetical protein